MLKYIRQALGHAAGEPSVLPAPLDEQVSRIVLKLLQLGHIEHGAWIDAAFSGLMGRPPDRQGREHFLKKLERGSMTREQAIAAIRVSAEFRELMRRRRKLLGIYGERPASIPTRFERLAGLQLEVTSHCNLRCAMCLKAWGKNEHPRHFPLDLANRITQVTRDTEVAFFGFGEPLMNPDFWKIVECWDIDCRRSGFTTNGLLLSEECCDRIIAKEMGWINVSVDAATRETYHRIRGKGKDFDRLLGHISYLTRKRENAVPKVIMNMTVMRLNLEEVLPFCELAGTLGADEVLFQPLNPQHSPKGPTRGPDGEPFDYDGQIIQSASSQDMAATLEEAKARCARKGLGFTYAGDYPVE